MTLFHNLMKIDFDLSRSTFASLIYTPDKIITANVGKFLLKWKNALMQFICTNLIRDDEPNEAQN
jgi:hypothetical protein